LTEPVSIAEPTTEPEVLVCPGCGLQITTNVDSSVLTISHPLPGCKRFKRNRYPEDYLTEARELKARGETSHG
jgi:hypothetical protein